MGFETFPPKLNMDPEKESVENNMAPLKKGVLGKQIAEGSHAKIYEMEREMGGKDFLVKIGETRKYEPPLLKALKLSFSRERTSRFLEKFLGPQFKINPDMDFINNGITEYLLIKKYFGGKEADDHGKNNNDVRENTLADISDNNTVMHKELLRVLGVDGLEKVKMVFSKHRHENFLPEEHLVIGHPPHLTKEQASELRLKNKKLPITYYIFQKRIMGKEVAPLQDVKDSDLKKHRNILERLLVFSLLTKKMYLDTGKLIDMRPEEIAKHPFEWFQKTSNLLVDKQNEQISFVDTRWLWDKKSILGKKYFNLVSWLGVRSVDRAIKKYTELLSKG